jgi:hypothetical protein
VSASVTSAGHGDKESTTDSQNGVPRANSSMAGKRTMHGTMEK